MSSFHAQQELTRRDLTRTIRGYVSESARDSLASETETCRTEWNWNSGTLNLIAPVTEAGDDLAYFNFSDAPAKGSASCDGNWQ